jgi:hypothetical protein
MTAPSKAKLDMERDTKLRALEQAQKLRDLHVDTRFNTLSEDVSNLDRRFSAQLGALDSKIEGGFDRLTETLKADHDREASQPAAIKVNLLLGTLGVVFPTITMAGIVILLLVNPIKDGLEEHKDSTSDQKKHGGRLNLIEERTRENRVQSTQATALLGERIAEKHIEQQAQLDRLRTSQDGLLAQRLSDAKTHGQLFAYHEWLRDDAEAIKRDLANHAALDDHPPALSTVAEIKGQLDALKDRVEDDAKASLLDSDRP